jgi:hypothetical protein
MTESVNGRDRRYTLRLSGKTSLAEEIVRTEGSPCRCHPSGTGIRRIFHCAPSEQEHPGRLSISFSIRSKSALPACSGY